jgi:hypothetical protein
MNISIYVLFSSHLRGFYFRNGQFHDEANFSLHLHFNKREI